MAEESAKIASVLLFGLLVVHADVVQASDDAIDRARPVLADVAIARDAVLDRLHVVEQLAEAARASEQLAGRLRVLHVERATAGDAAGERLRAITREVCIASDQVLPQRRVTSHVVEMARAGDAAPQVASDMPIEAARATDAVIDSAAARVLLVEQALAADLVLDDRRAVAAPAHESARAVDLLVDQLHARELVVEVGIVEDEMVGAALGQAWTANADNWAMSRYAPYTFHQLAVVDGVLYGLSDEGVFALAGGTDSVAGRIATAKVDVGNGLLVHPTNVYLEYELDGTASLDVTTTQSGSAQTYTYLLEQEQAGELTTGRFVLGRGLLGRHFTFALRLEGRRGHINDLSASVAPTKRRV